MESKFGEAFISEYKKLNKAQRDAVESIDGPVMVVAGPGTGKTQILALRIGYILQNTDTKAGDILCLTFTNSAVKAMRERLRRYIGPEASKVKIATFHSFGLEVLEKHYSILDLEEEPKLMDEKDMIALCDEILQENSWEHLRPRSDTSRYFRDLKSLISILKRERITPTLFENEVKLEIEDIKNDPDSISSRGESKGKLKKDAQMKIEGLERSLEAVKFYQIYEDLKKERNLFDFDDILESLNKIVEESEDVRESLQLNYQYILVDEHQDSSGVQNAFLKLVWSDVEKPNIFVVGDDRQLIYGFGGASLSYFENFKNMFGKAKQIILEDNYRSTQNILDSAHTLLESKITTGKLKSNHKESHPLHLVEAYYGRDEILAAGLEIKKKLQEGVDVNDIAILVPKNHQVRTAVTILKDMGLQVAGGEAVNLFDTPEAISFIRVLKILANPNYGSVLASSFFDKLSGIPPLKAHEFLKDNKMREFSLVNYKIESNNLFDAHSEINVWLGNLKSWLNFSNENVYSFVQKVGTEFLLKGAKTHEELVSRIEVLRTLLHLVIGQTEKNNKLTLALFLNFLDRIESYGQDIPLAIFGASVGIKVLTLHSSKGLEFDFVWIAHMDERSFGGGRAGGFSLPESVKEKLEVKDDEVLKRTLYVAITRAKRFCTISYAQKSYTGGTLELSHIVGEILDSFDKQDADQTEKFILKSDMKVYVENNREKVKDTKLGELVQLVAKDYEDRKVSVSLLNNFFECPWKWYFRNLLQLPEEKSESLEFGTAVHDAIDKMIKLGKVVLPEDKEVAKIVSRFAEHRLSEISANRETEQPVSVKDERFPHLSIYGKIDLIEILDKDTLRVTDFKTGGVRKKSDIEKINEEGRMSGYMRQLAMYSYLIKQSPKWTANVTESRLEFVEAKDIKDTFYNTFISDEQIDLIVRDISDYSNLIKSGDWVNRPCDYNSYGKNTECEYCKMAEIYK